MDTKEIRARLEATTPGEREIIPRGGCGFGYDVDLVDGSGLSGVRGMFLSKADAEFFVHAPDDMRYLFEQLDITEREEAKRTRERNDLASKLKKAEAAILAAQFQLQDIGDVASAKAIMMSERLDEITA